MRKIKVYKLNELPEEMQYKIYQKVGYRENPFQYDNWHSWEEFQSLFRDIIKETDSRYKQVYFKSRKIPEEWDLDSKALVKRIWRKLRDLPEMPTGYVADEWTFGFAKKMLVNIFKKKWDIEDFIKEVFWNFCEGSDADDEYYNSFECFKEDAEANEWEYTEAGVQI